MYDAAGAGSENFGKDGRKENGGWEKGVVGLRERGWQDVRALFDRDRRQNDCGVEEHGEGKRRKLSGNNDIREAPNGDQTTQSRGKKVDTHHDPQSPPSTNAKSTPAPQKQKQKQKQVFDGLCVFINGSTAPLVGDHRLKQLLAENGARVSIALGRRSVTHVILGTPNRAALGGQGGKGAGGGLAATKIQKEIMRVGGKGVKYVGVDW